MKTGGCHCGKIRFKVFSEFTQGLICNCSICSKKGFIHLIVAGEDFKFEGKESDLTTYTFATRTAKHLFCRHCGIASFYVPRSHPDGYSINLRCVDDLNLDDVVLEAFDGQHWEESINLIKP